MSAYSLNNDPFDLGNKQKELSLIDEFPLMLCRVNPQGIILLANNYFKNFFSRSDKDLIGLHFNKLIDNINNHQLQLEPILKPGMEPKSFESIVENSAGQKKWIEWTFSSLSNSQGFSNYQIIGFDITERKQTESILKLSEERFRILAENIPGIVYLCRNDKRYTILYINEAVLNITGYPKESFLSDKISFVELYHPDDKLKIFSDVDEALANKKPFKLVYQLKTISGKWIWIEENGNGVYVDGDLVLIEGFMNDITDRKNYELALLESEEKYRILFENMANGFALHEIICDENENPINYRFLEVNPAYEILTGLKADEIIGKTVLEVIPNIEKSWIEIFGKVALTGESTSYENHSPELGKYYEVFVFSPKLTHFAIIINDITVRKETELNLNKRITTLTQPIGDTSEINFYDLFDVSEIQAIQDAFSDATGVASIITETDGSPITKPSNFCRLCNDIIRQTEKGRHNCYKSDAVIGSYNPSGPIIQPCLSGSLWDAGSSINVGGKHIANWLIGQVLDTDPDENKMLEYAVEIGADIDEYSKALKEVKRMSREQFENVSKALFLISQQLSIHALHNLMQARHITEIQRAEEIIKFQLEELESKNAELERFTYTVSHDLKSPLITIKGFLGHLSTDARTGNFERFDSDLQRISKAADKMQDLLEDLLELSRIGRISNPQTSFPMSLAVRDATELLHAHIKNSYITLEIDDEMPVVYADKVRIRQVWQNLIENSIKYMGTQKNPNISIGFTSINKEIVYFIKDNGIGIEKQYFEKIFNLFDKLDAHTDGTGIGLSLVRRIIDIHNGKIWVESGGLNKGATFYFTLNTGKDS